ncbi:hypothetical protein EFM54_08590 [Lentilactobacillus buchneri]|uniref:hypothetical protein n=1 Tax=Lentilactobacillus buchneri TaxID=1581 RepID=UPI0021A3D07D|nr:hypothetical protein [Lentilactobacillus buchneri]MCT2899033.1 hypothetical protein [Lentilactobacillus buchneri]
MRFLLEAYVRLGQVILIDPKKSDGARWAKQHPKVKLIVPDDNDRPEDFLPKVNNVLSVALQELNNRQSAIYKQTDKISANYHDLNLKPIFIVIDEVASLAVGLKKQLLNDFQTLLTQLAMLGREAGIFLTLSLQEARHEFLSSLVRGQMGVRILLGRIDKSTCQFLFPEISDGFPIPIGGVGSGIISIQDGQHYGIEPIAMPTITEGDR